MREISLHILDLVTNSIEAEATRVIICIEEDQSKNLYRIRIRDNGRGMSKEIQERATDPFITSRHTRAVGLGLSLTSQLAKDCGGELKIMSEQGRGTTIDLSLALNHINRPPLGDMASTLSNLIIANPHVHILYIHKRDSQKFCFDSFWVKTETSDSQITNLEIAPIIRNFIKEGLQKR